MIYIYILIAFFFIKYIIVYRLRTIRNHINITTYSGKLKCKRLNETIDIMTGAWLYKLNKGKLKR